MPGCGRARKAYLRKKLADQGHRKSKILTARADRDAVRRGPPSPDTIAAVVSQDRWGVITRRYAMALASALLDWASGLRRRWSPTAHLVAMALTDQGRKAIEKCKQFVKAVSEAMKGNKTMENNLKKIEEEILEAIAKGKRVELDFKDQAVVMLKALGLGDDDRITIRIINEKSERDVQTRRPTVSELVDRSWGWLAHINAHGGNIYWMVEDQPVIVLDYDRGFLQGLSRMMGMGILPHAIVETSRGHYQVWIRLPEGVTKEQASAVQRYLTDKTGADPGAKGFPRLGRLPGFTNRKYQWDDGRHPWVRLHWALDRNQKEYVKAMEIAEANLRSLIESPPSQSFLKEPEHIGSARAVFNPSHPLNVVYQEIAHRVIKTAPRRPDGSVDMSALDARVALFLAQRDVAPDRIAQVLAGSPDLLNRHPNAEDYINRTVDFALRRRRGRRPMEPWLQGLLGDSPIDGGHSPIED